MTTIEKTLLLLSCQSVWTSLVYLVASCIKILFFSFSLFPPCLATFENFENCLFLSTAAGLVTAISMSIPPSLFREVFHISEPWVLDAIGSALMSGYVMSSSFLTCCDRTPHQKARVLTLLFYRGPSQSLLFFFCLGAGGRWTAAVLYWSRWCFWEFPVVLQRTTRGFKNFKWHSFDFVDSGYSYFNGLDFLLIPISALR